MLGGSKSGRCPPVVTERARFAGQCSLIELGFCQAGLAGYGLRRMRIDQIKAAKGELGEASTRASSAAERSKFPLRGGGIKLSSAQISSRRLR
jgi:hypothetical protein